jgi:hypothetical protein
MHWLANFEIFNYKSGTMVHTRRQLMVSGAAPSNAKTLKKDLLPVSGLLSTSGRGYKLPEVGSVPMTDFFSDSFVSWFRRMSSLVMVFLVCWSTTAFASARGPLPLSHRTRPAREVINLGELATPVPANLLNLVWMGNACNPPSFADATCDITMAAILELKKDWKRKTKSKL